jgi:probable rRNA maturation factor
MPVGIRLEGSPERVDRRALGKDARALLQAVGLPRTEWSVVLADDAFVRPLNHQWRDKDAATDVLSFPQEVPEAPGRFSHPPSWVGDVVISVETARRQADALGHSLDVELRVLLVHGLLHLLGYDHETGPEDAAEMAAEEARLLGLLGVAAGSSLIAR